MFLLLLVHLNHGNVRVTSSVLISPFVKGAAEEMNITPKPLWTDSVGDLNR